jgi:hypothetical protein
VRQLWTCVSWVGMECMVGLPDEEEEEEKADDYDGED